MHVAAVVAVLVCAWPTVPRSRGLGSRTDQARGARRQATAVQQSAGRPAGFASVEGQVVAASSGEPIPNATVRAAVLMTPVPPGGQPQPVSVAVDTDGRFRIVGLAGGLLNLTASAPGFVTRAYRPTSPSRAMQLGTHEQHTGIVLRLERAASIAGVVRNERGAPVSGVAVHVYQRVILTTRRVWSSIRQPVLTDASGAYLVPNLDPDEYIVSVPVLATTIPTSVIEAVRNAKPGSRANEPHPVVRAIEASRAPMPGPMLQTTGGHALLSTGGLSLYQIPAPARDATGAERAYRTTYHPSAGSMNDAAIVNLRNGEARTDIDITLEAMPARRLTGTIHALSGESAAFTGVHLFADGADERSIDYDVESAVTVTDAAGAFMFFNVAPGAYRLKVAIMPPPAGRGLPLSPPSEYVTAWASQAVKVGAADVEVGSIALQRPLVIRGRHVFRGAGAGNPMTTPSRLWTATVDGGMHSPPVLARMEPDGTFTLTGAMAGRYTLLGGGAPGWTVTTITAGGMDVTGAPIELIDRDVDVTIALSGRRTSAAGVVRDGRGMLVADAHVVAFPADYAQSIPDSLSMRMLRSTRSSVDGGYAVAGLPPGAYLFAAFPEGDTDEWPDRRVIAAAAKAAIRVELLEGAPARADLPLRRLIIESRVQGPPR